MKQSVGEIIGHSSDPRSFGESPLLVDNHQYVGVEVELENAKNFHSKYTSNTFWKYVEDGSLRNSGIELVMGVSLGNGVYLPLLGQDIVIALHQLETMLETYEDDTGRDVKITDRTGLHVHLDVRDLEVDELKRLALLYMVFERVFFAYSGHGRDTSPWCRPVYLTDTVKDQLADVLTSASDGQSVDYLNSMDKYHACNLVSIPKRGSMEFRIHEGTKDAAVILRWINILIELKMAAKNEEISIYEIPTQVSALGLLDFMEVVFPTQFHALVPHATNANILQGVRIAQEILQLHELKHASDLLKSSTLFKKSKKTLLDKWAKKHDRELAIPPVAPAEKELPVPPKKVTPHSIPPDVEGVVEAAEPFTFVVDTITTTDTSF